MVIHVHLLHQCGEYRSRTDDLLEFYRYHETKNRASESINTYSKYFPSKEDCFFNGITSNTKHLVGCWINKNTIARTSD